MNVQTTEHATLYSYSLLLNLVFPGFFFFHEVQQIIHLYEGQYGQTDRLNFERGHRANIWTNRLNVEWGYRTLKKD